MFCLSAAQSQKLGGGIKKSGLMLIIFQNTDAVSKTAKSINTYNIKPYHHILYIKFLQNYLTNITSTHATPLTGKRIHTHYIKLEVCADIDIIESVSYRAFGTLDMFFRYISISFR